MGTGARRAKAGNMPAPPRQAKTPAKKMVTKPQQTTTQSQTTKNQPQKPPASAIVYSVQQAAYMLGVSVRKTWDLVRRGERGQPGGLTSTKIGDLRKITRDDLDAFLARQRVA